MASRLAALPLAGPWAGGRAHDADPTWRGLLRHVTPLLRQHSRRHIELAAYVLLNIGYGIALPLCSKYLLDTVIPNHDLSGLGVVGVLLFAVYVFNALVDLRRAYVTGLVAQRVSMDLASRAFVHLQRLSHAYHASRKVGDMVARLSGDRLVVEQALAQAVGVALFLVLSVAVSAAAVVALSPALGALLLIVLPVFTAAYVVLRARLEQGSYELQNQAGATAASLQETLSAHVEIKAFGLEQWSASGYRERLERVARTTLRVIVTGALFETSMGLATAFGHILILGMGGFLVMSGQLTVGALVACIGLLSALFQPIAALSNLARTGHQAAGALLRLNELLDEPVEIADRATARVLGAGPHEIRFEGVSFGYERDRYVLNGIDLTLPAGARIAVVGPSGAGKSSLVHLLMRFSDPASGRVLLDGQDLRDLTLASVRGEIGLVPQDTFIFDASVRENIAIGRPGATAAEIHAAARAAHLESFFQTLPAGYETVLGERGVRMSGGQRQRLAIARAVLRNPSVLVLDEGTGALDPETERGIMATLDTLRPGRTTVMVTHRLALAATADRIIVLDHGQVVAEGSHDDLMRAGGVYCRLWSGTDAPARQLD